MGDVPITISAATTRNVALYFHLRRLSYSILANMRWGQNLLPKTRAFRRGITVLVGSKKFPRSNLPPQVGESSLISFLAKTTGNFPSVRLLPTVAELPSTNYPFAATNLSTSVNEQLMHRATVKASLATLNGSTDSREDSERKQDRSDDRRSSASTVNRSSRARTKRTRRATDKEYHE